MFPKKITVIGGSGFVGTHLCHLFEAKQQEYEILDLKMSKQFPEKYRFADVRDIESLRKTVSGDVVINLAAVHRDDVVDPAGYTRTNVDGAVNIAKVCDEKQVKKIIFTSSVAVYGFATSGIDENGDINPSNEYGRSKFEAEEVFRRWQNNGNRSLLIVRPTVIFGEGNRGNVFNLFNQIASGFFVMIGKGENKKSMAYIGNVAAFLEFGLFVRKGYDVYNYVDTPNMSMNELVAQVRNKLGKQNQLPFYLPYWLGLLIGRFFDVIARLTGKKLPISAVRVKKFVSNSEFEAEKKDLVGFKPPFTLKEGLHLTLQNEFIAPDPNREIFYSE